MLRILSIACNHYYLFLFLDFTECEIMASCVKLAWTCASTYSEQGFDVLSDSFHTQYDPLSVRIRKPRYVCVLAPPTVLGLPLE
jgi:hypothetical protein